MRPTSSVTMRVPPVFSGWPAGCRQDAFGCHIGNRTGITSPPWLGIRRKKSAHRITARVAGTSTSIYAADSRQFLNFMIQTLHQLTKLPSPIKPRLVTRHVRFARKVPLNTRSPIRARRAISSAQKNRNAQISGSVPSYASEWRPFPANTDDDILE